MSDSLRPHGLYSPWNSPGQNTGVVAFPFSRDLPNPGTEPRSPTLQVDSLPAEPQGKPKNTGVGSLSLPQLIFLTQELNQSLLHCSRILYQLSYSVQFSLSVMSDSLQIHESQQARSPCPSPTSRIHTNPCPLSQ